ncbi:hypothetical protein D3C76_1485920 [compost metagenome]
MRIFGRRGLPPRGAVYLGADNGARPHGQCARGAESRQARSEPAHPITDGGWLYAAKPYPPGEYRG